MVDYTIGYLFLTYDLAPEVARPIITKAIDKINRHVTDAYKLDINADAKYRIRITIPAEAKPDDAAKRVNRFLKYISQNGVYTEKFVGTYYETVLFNNGYDGIYVYSFDRNGECVANTLDTIVTGAMNIS